jgi:ankyrin repeat protein
MQKQSILYCDFKTFIEKISPKKSEENDNDLLKSTKNKNGLPNSKDEAVTDDKNNAAPPMAGATLLSAYKYNNSNQITNKFNKIFHAIENNYHGVVKSFLESENVEEYLSVKNQENKTAFYIAINNKNDDIIDLFLEKIKEQKIQLSYLYLFKAIRTRNPELVKKLVNLGIKVDSTDDQGKGVFHVLFSSFTKQIARCILIGDFLLEKGAPVNIYDADNWAPIHIAANKSCK